jgi:thiosulfate/3-mercaptopyruvate sulfurtransferase
LLSPAELARALASSAPPVLLDVRWEVGRPPLYEAFVAGHIPSAQFCDLDADLADPPGAGGRHPLPDPLRLQGALRGWGIDDGGGVVCYDGSTSVAAARAWWVLRWAGVTSVRVLDGGFAAWTVAAQPVQTGPATPPAHVGTMTVRSGSMPVLTADDAADLGRRGLLLDVRAPERYCGETEPIDPVAGHIPGARNLPAAENVADDGVFRGPDTVLGRLAELGIPRAGRDGVLGVYCGSGVTAAQSLLALEAAGQPAVLYPGSWSEWITDRTRPIAVGDGT